jgi:hypothetical protein
MPSSGLLHLLTGDYATVEGSQSSHSAIMASGVSLVLDFLYPPMSATEHTLKGRR